MATLQLVSMAVLYFTVRRYWSPRTALAALILYTAMPRAIWSGRLLWNPYLILPFIIGYLATGFLMAEGKRWPRRLNLALFACAVQAHPITAITAPLTLGFWAMDWRKTQAGKRQHLIIDYGIGIALAVLVLSPWIVALLHQYANMQPGSTIITPRTASAFSTIWQAFIENPTTMDLVEVPINYRPPPAALWNAYLAIGWFTFLASVFLVGRALIRRRHYPDAMIGIGYLMLPLVYSLLPARIYDQYMVPLLPLAAIIQAVALIGRGPRNPQLLRLGAVIMTVMCALQIGLAVDLMAQVHSFNKPARGAMPGLNATIKLRDEAVRPGYETIYLVEGGGPTEFEQELAWLILATKGPSRVLWGDQFALPVPDAGATYVGYVGATHIPELYANREARLVLDDFYRVVDLPPHSEFTPTCRPEGPNHLNNGTTILGYYTPGDPSPRSGQPWTIYILWQGTPKNAGQGYQLFTHLVDAKGLRYTQSDIHALNNDLWREGELLVSRVTLPPVDLPDSGPLSLHVGMYTLPSVTNAAVVDDNGNPVASWVTIPICRPASLNK